MPHQSSAARPDAVLPAYQAMFGVVTFGVWLLGLVDVFGQGLFSTELHPGLGFHPTSFYLFTLVIGLAALRRGYGPTWLEGIASGKVTLGVTVVLWLLSILRTAEQLFELPYLAFLDGVFGAPSEASFTSFWLIVLLTLLHSLDAHVAHLRSSRAAWLSYALLCAIVMLVLHQVENLLLAVGHYDLEGLSLISSVIICSFAGFIAPEAPAVGLLYNQRTPKTNALGLVALLVVLVWDFAFDIVIDNTVYILSAGLLVLAGLPFALSALRSSEWQKCIAAGEMTPEGVLTKFVPERRYLGNTYRPSGIFGRMSAYAVFDAPEWQRYAIQAVLTLILAYGAIALGRTADTPIAAIWWANGYLASCLMLRPKTQWTASVALFYAVVLIVNLMVGNAFIASIVLTSVNVVEGVVLAIAITATLGLRVHGRQVSAERISVGSFAAVLLTLGSVHVFGSLIGGGLVTHLFEGSLALNMLTWGSGGLMGSSIILMLSAGKLLEQHFGFKSLEPRLQRFGLIACLYVGTVFALYAFLPVPAFFAAPHMLFIVLSVPLVLVPSLFQAGGVFLVTSSIYYYFGHSRWGMEGWHAELQNTFVITLMASVITLALVARYGYAKAREAEKRALDLAPNALLTLDAQRRVLTISKNAQEWFEVSEHKLVGMRFDECCLDFKPHTQAITDLFQANPTASYTAQVTRTLASGATLTLEVTLQGNDDVSLPYTFVVSVMDVSELQKQRVLLNSTLKNAEALLAAGTNAYTVVDEDFNRVLISEGAKELFGYRIKAEAVPFLQMYKNMTHEKREAQLAQLSALETGRILNFPDIDEMNTPDGRTIFTTRASRWFDNPLGPGRLLWTSLTDVTALERQRRFSDTLLNRNSSIILTQDKAWKIMSCSEAWVSLMDYSRGETVGRDLIEFMHPDDAEASVAFRSSSLTSVTGSEIVKNTLRFLTKSGEERVIELQSVVEELEGNMCNIVTLVDITEIMRTQNQLQMLVDRDELTGLYSRRGLKERFGDGARTKTAGVYILDLDHFKSVNDSYGHEAGDALLRAIGQTMTRLTETAGCAARLGGEEFAIIRPWQGWEEAKEFGEALRVSLEQTVVVDGARQINRTASIGIAMLPASEALFDAMRLADHFAREAKMRGRNIVCAGEEEELRALKLSGTFIASEEIQLALEAGEFYYAVQPIWNVEDRRIEGFEALIRWQKADGTVLSPLQFVNLFDEVTRKPAFAALNTAMREDVLAKLSDFPDAYVSFNYKLEHLAYVGAAEELMGVYEVAKDHADRVIMIELSEAAFSQRGNLDVLRAELKTLAENGFVIALDDFGVESSNLNRLQELPIHVVKLDKTLIDDLNTSQRVRSLVRGIGLIVRILNMKAIVEGVETAQQAQTLMRHHLVIQQGYLHAKPMRPEEVMGQLSKIGADVSEVTSGSQVVENVLRQTTS